MPNTARKLNWKLSWPSMRGSRTNSTNAADARLFIESLWRRTMPATVNSVNMVAARTTDGAPPVRPA